MKWASKSDEDKILTADECDTLHIDEDVADVPYKLTIINVEEQNKHRSLFQTSSTPVFVLFAVFILLVFGLDLRHSITKSAHRFRSSQANQDTDSAEGCSQPCRISLVESIPEGLVYPNQTIQPSVFQSWLDLIRLAESEIDIASFYWSLTGDDVGPHPSDWQGERIFDELKAAALKRGVRIRVAQNKPSKSAPDRNTAELQRLGAALVRSLDFERLVGAGILHTKLWLVDRKHFFVGSPNMDWRSLTQVKELGATVFDCPCLAEDVVKIFEVYWSLGDANATVPKEWPSEYSTQFNHLNPMAVVLNGTPAFTYLASSPPEFCPSGRTKDLESIMHTMSQAKETIDIAVMDYMPAMMYSPRHQYWPDIDDQLRRMAIDKSIRVRLLVSQWAHTPPAMSHFLKSLTDLSRVYPHVDIQVKVFSVPIFTPDQEKIPFARVNHNKYMVTDQAAYIGTSNWSGDYFLNTGGVALVTTSTEGGNGTESLRDQLQQVFDRDWNSNYARTLDSAMLQQ